MRVRFNNPRADHRTSLAIAGVLLFAGVVLAGCLGGDEDEGAGQQEEPVEDEVLTFEPGLGPGHVEPLINLTNDTREDAQAILAKCRGEPDLIDCANEHLMAIVGAVGSDYAFDVLDTMSRSDSAISRQDHPMAHVLGRHALYVYGTIGETLITCSHKVFQGCIHGALQEYFEHVDLEQTKLDRVCPEDATHFESYACMHGLGHGLVLATGYDLPASLDLCASLERNTDRRSCYGGAFMENVVAYMDHIRAGGTFVGHGRDPQTMDPDDPNAHHDHHGDHGDGGHHAHGGHGVPDFWINPDDVKYPCNVIDKMYQPSCWLMQTSLVLYLNRGDFPGTAAVCEELDDASRQNCYASLGRDASARSQRDPGGVHTRCLSAPEGEPRSWCIRGAVRELVTNYVDPEEGLPFCEAFAEDGKEDCYRSLGGAARSHYDEQELEEFCAKVEEDHRGVCREGARL